MSCPEDADYRKEAWLYLTIEASCAFLPEGDIANSTAAQGNCSLESHII